MRSARPHTPSGRCPTRQPLLRASGSTTTGDLSAIRRDAHELDQLWCPHTATAAKVFRRVLARGARGHWVIVATAHPAKFHDIVEPQAGREVPVPESLAELLSLPRQETELEPTLQALRAEMQKTR